MFISSLDPAEITKKQLDNKSYWKGKKQFPRVCNYKLFLDPKNELTADHSIQCIFPGNVQISAVNKNEETEDFING